MKHVYFIGNGTHIKIGVASDPRARLRAIQCGCPETLELLLCIEGAFDTEREIHRRLADDHIRGEWFKDGPQIRALMADLSENSSATLGIVEGDERPRAEPHFDAVDFRTYRLIEESRDPNGACAHYLKLNEDLAAEAASYTTRGTAVQEELKAKIVAAIKALGSYVRFSNSRPVDALKLTWVNYF